MTVRFLDCASGKTFDVAPDARVEFFMSTVAAGDRWRGTVFVPQKLRARTVWLLMREEPSRTFYVYDDPSLTWWRTERVARWWQR